MTRKIVALATATIISATALAPTAFSMGMEFNMLTGAIYNELRARGLPTDKIDTLTLSQIAIIKGIIDSNDDESLKTQSIRTILNR